MTENDIAWAAGFFDGEGTIDARPRQRAHRCEYRLSLYVGQVDPRPLRLLAVLFGGSVASRRAGRRGRPMWMWRVTGVGAETTLRTLLPYLIVKAEQARLALALRKMIRANVVRGSRLPEAETAARMALVSAIKEDKWRSHE